MVPTTRSSRTPKGAAAQPNSNKVYDFIASDNENDDASVTPSAFMTKKARTSTTGSNKDKVYRKASPKPQLEQLKFPARGKTARAKKTTEKTAKKPTRKSLPASLGGASGKKATAGKKKAADKRQSTLTQINWIPSTYPEDEDGDDMDQDALKTPVVDLTGELSEDDDGEWEGRRSAVKKTIAGKKKTKKQSTAENKKTATRGRKRRKTTGDLELELDKHAEDDDDEDAVTSSRYYTQTLTQMPSWRPFDEDEDDGGFAALVGSNSDDGFGDNGLGLDNVPDVEGKDDLYAATPQPKKRKRPSPSPPKSNNPTGASPPSIPPLTQSVTSLIPQTPSKQRAGPTEIPSSQPSPFTPDLDIAARNWSPLAQVNVDRTPLKERSTNVDAPTPSGSIVGRKMSRSEIPGSWTTVNGGLSPLALLSSSSQGRRGRVGRTPLKEISFVDVDVDVDGMSLEMGENRAGELNSPSLGLGERSSQRSQRLDDEIIMDSEEEFQGFPDDDDDEPGAPGSPSPRRASARAGPQPSTGEENVAEVVASDNGEAVASTAGTAKEEDAGARESVDLGTTTQRPSSPSELQSSLTEKRLDEVVELDNEETVASTSGTLAQGSPRHTSSVAIVKVVATGLEESAATSRKAVTHPSPFISREPKAPTQQASPQLTRHRNAHPEQPAEEDDTDPETPRHVRRRPSSSSAIDRDTPISSPQKTSPAMAPVSQLGYSQRYKSQAFESQRVPFEIVRQMAPQTDRSDVIVSIHPEHVKHITEGAKTHEFRNFRLFRTVGRMWIYITSPVQELKYMAIISGYKLPGEIAAEDPGIGNRAFNERKGAKYAYELKQVYQLNNPVSLGQMQENGWVEQAPQKFKYVPPAVLGELMGNLRWALFEEREHEHRIGEGLSSQSQHGITESQELKEQLRSDIAATQKRPHQSSSPRGLRHPEIEEEDEFDAVIVPSSQNPELEASEHISATLSQPTMTSSARQVGFAKPSAPPSRSQRSVVQIEDSPPTMRFSQFSPSQHIVKSTVRPSQATTASLSSQSQQLPPSQPTTRRTPARRAQRVDSSGLPSLPGEVLVVDDSPVLMRAPSGSGKEGTGNNNNNHTQSSLGLGMLLGSSQGLGLADFGGEHDSLMDDSRIRMPPGDEVIWDSEGET